MSTGPDTKGGPSPEGAAAGPRGPEEADAPPNPGANPWPPVLWVLVLGAAVAIAAKETQLLLPRAALEGGWLLVVRLAGAALVATGVAGLIRERTRLLAEDPERRDPTVVGLRAATTIMCAVTLLALLNPPPPSPNHGRSGLSFGIPGVSPWGIDGPGSGEVVEARSRGGESLITGRGPPAWLDAPPLPAVDAPEGSLLRRMIGVFPWLFVFVLMLVALRLLTRRPRVVELELDDPLLVVRSEAEESLEASLAEVLRYGGDPRGQITRAYHSLLRALALAGAPREPQEAPHEHLRRALGPLGVRPGALHRLTALYVLAQFGARPVTERHRVAAVDALETSLADLRSAVRSTSSRAALVSGARA